MYHLPLLPQSKVSIIPISSEQQTFFSNFMKFKRGVESTEAQHSMQEVLVVAQ